MTNEKPHPKINMINQTYFKSGADGLMKLQRCQSCFSWIYYPRIACPHCLSMSLAWEAVSGEGVIHSFAIVYRPQHVAFFDEVPITLVAVKLAEGPILISTLVSSKADNVQIGDKVKAVFEPFNNGEFALPKFKAIE